MGTPGGLSAPEERAWTGLLRAHAALVRDVDAALRSAHRLPLSWFEILCALADAPGGRARMGELAAHVGLTPAGASGLVDRIEEAGLVARRPSAADGRGTDAAITAAGRGLLERARRTHRDAVRRHYTGRLDERELGVVARLWERVHAAAPRG